MVLLTLKRGWLQLEESKDTCDMLQDELREGEGVRVKLNTAQQDLTEAKVGSGVV
jgi:hypothetical protein